MAIPRSTARSNDALPTKAPTQGIPQPAMILLTMALCFWLGSVVAVTADDRDDTVPGEIRARRFVVPDETGKARVEIGRLSNGETGVIIWNSKQDNAVILSVADSGGPRMAFQNSKGNALLDLIMAQDKSPTLVMRNADGTRRLGMVVTPDGTATIRLYDPGKQNRCGLTVSANGDAEISLLDEKGMHRAGLRYLDRAGAAVTLHDSQGRHRALMQVNPDGEPDAALLGPEREPLWSARSKERDKQKPVDTKPKALRG